LGVDVVHLRCKRGSERGLCMHRVGKIVKELSIHLKLDVSMASLISLWRKGMKISSTY